MIWPQLNGFTIVKVGNGIIPSRPFSVRKSVLEDVSFTVAATAIPAVAVVGKEELETDMNTDKDKGEKIRIRYLTPRECMRLQGQKDEDIDKMMALGLSKSAMYKLAGNSIVVDVLEAIFKGIYVNRTFEPSRGKQVSLDQW